MNRSEKERLWRTSARCGLGVVGLAALTVVLHRLNLRSALLYLIVVVFVSLTGDLVASVIVSFIALLCLAFFLSPPSSLLGLDDPLNAVALLAFLTTALVVTRLVSRRRASFLEIAGLRDQLTLVIDSIPALTGVTLPSGSVERVNRRWLEYTGIQLHDAKGSGWTRALHPEDREAFASKGRAARERGNRSRSRCACDARTESIGGS